MEKIGIQFKKHNFEARITRDSISFFEIPKKGVPVRLGGASYMLSRDEAIMHLTGGFTIKPDRFKLSQVEIVRLERALIGEAERAIARRHPRVNSVVGHVMDLHRMVSFDAGSLFNPERARQNTKGRIRLGRGKRRRPQRRRPK